MKTQRQRRRLAIYALEVSPLPRLWAAVILATALLNLALVALLSVLADGAYAQLARFTLGVAMAPATLALLALTITLRD